MGVSEQLPSYVSAHNPLKANKKINKVIPNFYFSFS